MKTGIEFKDNILRIDDHQLSNYLKGQGLNFNERVNVFERIFKALEPALERQISAWEKEYKENPRIKEEYKNRFKLIDFVPGIGLFTHERMNETKRAKHPTFYRMANEGLLNRLKEKSFNMYHYMTICPAVSYGLVKLLEKTHLIHF